MSSVEWAGATVFTSRPCLTWLGLVSFFLAGCAVHGPDAMRASRLAYNESVQVSDQRELVLNLVRLRYSDAPEFLAINGISTQMNFQASASIGGDFGEVEDSNSAFVSPGASVGYSETPTITFTPQRDQEFTRQLVAPVELDSVYLLTHYGWGIDRVLRLVARDLNGLSNAISRETNGTRDAESLILFADIASRLRRLEEAQLISIGVDQRREVLSAPIPTDRITADDLLSALDAGYRFEYLEAQPAYVLSGSYSHYVLQVERDAWDHADFVEVARLLGLPEHQTTYEVDPGGNVSKVVDGR